MFDKNSVLISGVALYKDEKGVGRKWFVIKQNDETSWELPKAITRKVESSVRAIIRTLQEQGGMSIRVLEEAGRAGGATTVNGRTIPQRHIYYLATQTAKSEEGLGFNEFAWLDYAIAKKKLSKREQKMLTSANEELKKVIKKRQKKKKEKERLEALEEKE